MIDIGHTIGNYKVTAKLGEGGMGVVYLAEHPVIGKKVAMKAIHPELSKNSDVVSRFITEAKAVNQIGHEHIVDIADFGNTPEGEFYFVMEYLQGESLSDRLKREKRIPLGQAMSIGAQIADALNASHQQGIIHRDLKPENIFLCHRGANREFVKVLDFGLAKLTQNDQKVTHKTRTGSVMGTPYYMSPEQCEGKTEIDYRADIYSLGVLIFEMLTGKVPFGGEGYGEIIVKHVTMPPPSVRSVVPELPEFMDPIMYRVLAKDRDQRFQTMADLREALLDPERYASSAPEIGIPDDLSGIVRAAAPMARAELELRSALGHPSQILTPPPPGGTPSGRGELMENIDNLIRTRSGSRLVLLLGLGSAAVALFAVFGRHDTRRPLPVASMPLHPATVRVNFNSDPDGAVVARADGKTLGLTPLSIEIAYSDSAVEFQFKKQGYEPKTMYVVPNLPSPLFATLRRADIEPAAVEGAGGSTGAPPRASPVRAARARRPPRRRSSIRRRTTKTASSSPASGRHTHRIRVRHDRIPDASRRHARRFASLNDRPFVPERPPLRFGRHVARVSSELCGPLEAFSGASAAIKFKAADAPEKATCGPQSQIEGSRSRLHVTGFTCDREPQASVALTATEPSSGWAGGFGLLADGRWPRPKADGRGPEAVRRRRGCGRWLGLVEAFVGALDDRAAPSVELGVDRGDPRSRS